MVNSSIMSDAEELSIVENLSEHYHHVEEQKEIDQAYDYPPALILVLNWFYEICENDWVVADECYQQLVHHFDSVSELGLEREEVINVNVVRQVAVHQDLDLKNGVVV